MSFQSDVVRISLEIMELKRSLAEKQLELKTLYVNCEHEWDYPQGNYDPIITKAHSVPAHVMNQLGMKTDGPYHVPEKITPRWTRKCKVCSVVQSTLTQLFEATGNGDFQKERFDDTGN